MLLPNEIPIGDPCAFAGIHLDVMEVCWHLLICPVENALNNLADYETAFEMGRSLRGNGHHLAIEQISCIRGELPSSERMSMDANHL